MYPDYEPNPDMSMPKLLSKLHGAKSLPLPYVNGCLWDINCKKYDIYNQSSLKDKKGNILKYGLNDLYFACVYNDYWKNIILNARNNLKDINNNLSAGIYYDMLGAVKPNICYAKNPGHGEGDAFSWQEGVINILKETNGVILTEGNAEIYIPYVHGFLMHLYTNERNIVPLWKEVYGDYVNSFGWTLQDKIDINELLVSINKAKYFGSKALGSPWMTQQIQDKLIDPVNIDVLKYIAKQ